MRRASVGTGKGPAPLSGDALKDVVLRTKTPSAHPPPSVGPGFMRRSCTFVTEGSWRKSSFGIGSGQKETKDRHNLALQVRKKAAQLGGGIGEVSSVVEDEDGDTVDNGNMDGFHNSQLRSSGRVSRFVGNLKSWSSSEDVRHSVVGVFTRTVNVIKQRPVSRKTKEKAIPKNTDIGKAPHSIGVNKLIPKSTPKTKDPIVKPKEPPLSKSGRPMPNKTPIPTKKRGAAGVDKGANPPSSKAKSNSNPKSEVKKLENKKWLRHLHDAEANYCKDGRHRRPHPPPQLPDPEEGPPPPDLRDVEDGLETDNNSESVVESCSDEALQNKPIQENVDSSCNSTSTTSTATPQTSTSSEALAKKSDSGAPTGSSQTGGQFSPQSGPCGQSSGSGGPRRRMQEVQIIQIVEGPSLIQPSEVKVSQGVVLSAEPVLTPIELLRRKDLKIRQELEEKQNLIADILNIPRQDFDSVADMAGEVGLSNKEPRELVLGAIYQAKKLQETLNEVQTVRDSDIIVAQACTDSYSKGSLPLYHSSMETMEKLLSISGTLTQFLNSLMVLISDRDEERERMRKELVSSRERVHQLHMQQNLVDPSFTVSTSSDAFRPPQTSLSSSSPVQSQLSAPPPSTLEATSPHSSRPSSFVSVNSSLADQSDSAAEQPNTDEETKSEGQNHSSTVEVPSVVDTTTEKCEETENVGESLLAVGVDEPSKDAHPLHDEDEANNT